MTDPNIAITMSKALSYLILNHPSLFVWGFATLNTLFVLFAYTLGIFKGKAIALNRYETMLNAQILLQQYEKNIELLEEKVNNALANNLDRLTKIHKLHETKILCDTLYTQYSQITDQAKKLMTKEEKEQAKDILTRFSRIWSKLNTIQKELISECGEEEVKQFKKAIDIQNTVNPLNPSLKPGEFHIIAGETNVGKSTFNEEIEAMRKDAEMQTGIPKDYMPNPSQKSGVK